METRKLGGQGLVVPALGLGCLGLAGAYGPVAEPDARALVAAAIDRGVTFFDTADYYGQGEGEALLGRALAGRSDSVLLATKTGIVHRDGGPPAIDGSSDHIRRSCEESLRRLGTDHVDLYYLARVDPKVPIEESVGALGELVAAGKVRHIGLSEASSQTLRRAHAVHPLSAVQTEYALWERHPEHTVLPVCRDLGIALVASKPLGSGMLTGTRTEPDALAPGDFRLRDPRFGAEHLDGNRRLAAGLTRLAREAGADPAQLALAWLLYRGEDIVPIPGTLSLAHLDVNAAAVDLVMDHAVTTGLDALFPPGAAHGMRYAPPLMATIDRDPDGVGPRAPGHDR